MAITQTKSVEITSGSGTWTVPDGITLIFVTLLGGGGGGGGSSNIQSPWGAGGSGEFGLKVPLKVTPGSGIFYSVGLGGVAGDGADPIYLGQGFPGTDTTFGPFSAKTGNGGGANPVYNPYAGGSGGGVGGEPGSGGTGVLLAGNYVGGGFAGGSCGQAAVTVSTHVIPPAGGAPGRIGGLGGEPHGGRAGGGGASSLCGDGGEGGGDDGVTAENGNPPAATSYGAGGGSAGQFRGVYTVGGVGRGGYIMLQWIA